VSRARPTRSDIFLSQISRPLPTTPGPFLPRAGAVKDAHLRAREGLVLDCSEHGRTMRNVGLSPWQQRRRMSCLPSVRQTLRKVWLPSHADIRGNDRDPNGPRPAASGQTGLGRAANPAAR
jgi:hypothetical protein